MHLYSTLAAATNASGAENYPYIVALLAIVISIVAIFQVAGLRRAMSESAATNVARPAPAAAARATSSTPADDGIAPEIVAAIAAAVATVTGKSGRIVSIRKVDTAWEKAGRQSVLSSHKIR